MLYIFTVAHCRMVMMFVGVVNGRMWDVLSMLGRNVLNTEAEGRIWEKPRDCKAYQYFVRTFFRAGTMFLVICLEFVYCTGTVWAVYIINFCCWFVEMVL
jgi:phenylacetate-coenzyme A ligase PaaK-like adenylate-forming protein